FDVAEACLFEERPYFAVRIAPLGDHEVRPLPSAANEAERRDVVTSKPFLRAVTATDDARVFVLRDSKGAPPTCLKAFLHVQIEQKSSTVSQGGEDVSESRTKIVLAHRMVEAVERRECHVEFWGQLERPRVFDRKLPLRGVLAGELDQFF